MSQKLLDSFKAADFDADYFVNETRKAGADQTVLAQLEACATQLSQELSSVIKQTNQSIIESAIACDATTGNLLSAREQLASIQQVLKILQTEEQMHLVNLKEKHSQLQQSIEAARIVRKLIKLHMDANKLNALFPSPKSINSTNQADLREKVRMVLGPIDELPELLNDLAELEPLELAKEDIRTLTNVCHQFMKPKK